MNDRRKQRLLVREAVMRTCAGHAQLLRHGLDAGGTEADERETSRRRVQDQLAQLLGRGA